MKRLSLGASKRLEACFNDVDYFIVVTTRNPRTNVKHVKILSRRVVGGKLKTVIEWEAVSFWTKVNEFVEAWGAGAGYALRR
jgi:hypothetical protein